MDAHQWILAEDPSAFDFNSPSAWLQFGVIGLMFGLLAFGSMRGWIFFKPAVDKEDKSHQKALEAADKELARVILDCDRELLRVLQDRDRIIAERDRAALQRDELAEVLRDKLIPIIEEFMMTTRTMGPVFLSLQQLNLLMPDLQRLANRRDPRGD